MLKKSHMAFFRQDDDKKDKKDKTNKKPSWYTGRRSWSWDDDKDDKKDSRFSSYTPSWSSRGGTSTGSSFWRSGFSWGGNRDSNDPIKLASYRKSIGNFVHIIAKKNVPVQFANNGQSKTNGKTVYLQSNITDKNFDAVVGLALHEGSHVLLTNFSVAGKLMETYSIGKDSNFNGWVDHIKKIADNDMRTDYGNSGYKKYVMNQLMAVINWVEDRRIDSYVYNDAPGYRTYYEDMYKEFFQSNEIDNALKSPGFRTTDWNSYMVRFINLINKNRDLNALPGLDKIWEILDLKNIDRLKSTKDSIDLAHKIYGIINENLSIATKPPESDSTVEQGEGGGEGQGQGTGDGQGEGTGDGSSGSSQKTSHRDIDKELQNEASGAGSGNGNEKEGEQEQGQGQEENGEDGQGEDDTEQGDGDTSDDGDGSDGEETRQVPYGTTSRFGGSGVSGLPLTEAQANAIREALKKQEKFLKGENEKQEMDTSTLQKVDATDKANMSTENVNLSAFNGRQDVEVKVVRNFTKSLVDNIRSDMWSSYGYNSEAVIDGIQLGKLLAKKLTVRSETRDTVFNRQRKGKIDSRRIASAGHGEATIFDRTETFKFNPGMIHISIDNSGSMSGGKLANAVKCATAIAVACKKVENMDCVVSFRADGSVGNSTGGAIMLIAYDSRRHGLSHIRNMMPLVSTAGGTPEGLCFDAVMDEIIKDSNGKDSYFINFSDGAPGAYNYGGSTAIEHTASMVKKIKSHGIKVLSFFIESRYGSSSHLETQFKTMYGREAKFIDVTALNDLARTLNKKFLEKK